MRMALLKSALSGAGLLEAAVCACLVAELAACWLHPVFLRRRLLVQTSAWLLQQFTALRASLSFHAEGHAAASTTAKPGLSRWRTFHTTQNPLAGFKPGGELLRETPAEPGFS
jgi:hypothetical protein